MEINDGCGCGSGGPIISNAFSEEISTSKAMKPGEIVGDYEVLGSLGAGGIGEVYKVRHVISQRTEAMKFLRPDRSTGDLSERFLREIRLLAALSHPHIAQLHTAFRVEERIAMVMEFIEGEDLHWKMRAPWPRRTLEGLEYIRQVLTALEYAHARGVVHRDIKPSNVMITKEGQAKLLDFGMALQTAELSTTRPGFVLGSLHYMSPEQVRGERVDHRSDIYSIGITLYELITGRRPFEGATEYDIMSGHLHQEPKWPSELNPAIPQSLSMAIARAMSKSSAERFQFARDFLAALGDIRLEDMVTLETMVYTPPSRGVSSQGSGSGSGSGPGSVRGEAAKPASGGSRTSNIEASKLDSVSRELATFIGPIAKVVVKRAAGHCSSLDELYSAVASEISSEKDRSAFLARKPR